MGLAVNRVDGSPGSTAGRARFTLTLGQVVLLVVLLGCGLPVLIFTTEIGMINTVLLFLFVVFAGLAACHATRRALNDAKLAVLQSFWLVKVGLTLVLLYVGWIPQLDPATSPAWGYDPQRYFVDAYELLENGWNPLVGSNYQGVIFYYAAIFYVFGHNPILPALINGFITLLTTLYLIRLAYEFKGSRGRHDWTIAGLLLIPEVIWYDTITSRETLAAALIVVAVLTAGRYIVRSANVSLRATILITGACFASILAVRTSMAFAVVGAVAGIALLLRPAKKTSAVAKFFMLVLVIGLLAVGPWMQEVIGGYAVSYTGLLQGLQSFEDNVASASEWSENSVGLLLSPANTWEAIVFTPPRMILYLAAPLPNAAVPLYQLGASSWSAWQQLLTVMSSVLNLLALPYAAAGFAAAWTRRRLQPGPMVVHIGLWVTFIAIVGGNIIIHERYRVMMSLLLFACAWFGYTGCTPAQVRRFGYAWIAILGTGALFFLIYKLLL